MTSTLSTPDALTRLADRLRALPSSGAAGFEGLVRNLLEAITGQLYRLAKSGPQGGTDLRSASANTLQVGLEAKRFAAGTRLPQDQLEAKLTQAASQADPLDLWVLAATREVTDTDARALETNGTELGLAVLVLDWPEEATALPELAVPGRAGAGLARRGDPASGAGGPMRRSARRHRPRFPRRPGPPGRLNVIAAEARFESRLLE